MAEPSPPTAAAPDPDPGPAPTAAVVGAGATGTLLAVELAAAGREVVVCARRPLERLRVTREGRAVEVAPPVLVDPAGAGRAGVVVLTTKAHQVPGTAGWLAALAGPGSVVVVLQNGVEHVERVAPLAPGADVVPGLIWCEAEAVAPGDVVSRGMPAIEVAAGPGGDRVAELFAGTAVEVRTSADFASAAWRKLCTNVAASGITALTGQRLEVLGVPEVAALARALVAEATAVARAEGADLPDDLGDLVPMMAGMVGSGSSMLHDRLAGRPMEHDAIYGPVLRGAARHGLAVPATEVVHALLVGASPG